MTDRRLGVRTLVNGMAALLLALSFAGAAHA